MKTGTGKPESPKKYRCDNIAIAMKQLVAHGWELTTENFKAFVTLNNGYKSRQHITDKMFDDQSFCKLVYSRIYK